MHRDAAALSDLQRRIGEVEERISLLQRWSDSQADACGGSPCFSDTLATAYAVRLLLLTRADLLRSRNSREGASIGSLDHDLKEPASGGVHLRCGLPPLLP